MWKKKHWFTLSGTPPMLLVLALMLPTGARADSKYKVLHRFTGRDGSSPSSDLIFDGAGNLYGTTYSGGTQNGGTVFKLSPNSDGTWTESVLHNFCHQGCGGLPPSAGLVFDAAGNLYGTTDEFGGAFKLAPNSDGTWTESLLASMFRPASQTDLVFDAAGNLYGEELVGGAFDYGKVFELTPNLDGSWTEIDLYSFTGGADGQYPQGRLSLDSAGNLYGTTSAGGNLGCPITCGVVFKLDASHRYSVLHSFTSDSNGARPIGGVTLDAAGNLYGTTLYGGNLSCDLGTGCGVVFKLDSNLNYKVLHRFANNPGELPFASVILDAAGNLFGTTYSGGPANGGVVFKLTPRSGGPWAYSVLHVFLGTPAMNPGAGLVLDKVGNLYGSAQSCSPESGCSGVIYEITP